MPSTSWTTSCSRSSGKKARNCCRSCSRACATGRAARPSWRRAAACMRTLHTFKGGARLAGAMRLGEMAHRLETAGRAPGWRSADDAGGAEVEALLGDALSDAIDACARRLPRPCPWPSSRRSPSGPRSRPTPDAEPAPDRSRAARRSRLRSQLPARRGRRGRTRCRCGRAAGGRCAAAIDWSPFRGRAPARLRRRPSARAGRQHGRGARACAAA